MKLNSINKNIYNFIKRRENYETKFYKQEHIFPPSGPISDKLLS
jgi:hypothetical protein